MTEPARHGATAWIVPGALLAAGNLSLAAVLARSSTDRAEDLWIFHTWLQQWLSGVDVITAPGQLETVDYPPWAFITFLPLGLLPPSMVVTAAIITAIVVMPAIAFASARVMAPRIPVRHVLVPALMVLWWGAGARSIIMFTTLPLLFGLLAVWRSDRTWPAGVLLGLSLAKPHIALPFLVCTLGQRRYRVPLVAALVVALELIAYSAWVSANPFAVTWEWLRAIGVMYSGTTALVGITSVRAMLAGSVRGGGLDLAMVLLTIGGLVLMWQVRRRTIPTADGGGGPLAVPVGLIVVLLCFYHYWEDLMLVAPIFMAVYFGRDALPPYGRLAVLLLIQGVLMTDIRQRGLPVAIDLTVMPWLLDHSYRLVIILAAAYLAAMVRRGERGPA